MTLIQVSELLTFIQILEERFICDDLGLTWCFRYDGSVEHDRFGIHVIHAYPFQMDPSIVFDQLAHL